jgi:urease accessory protein
MYDAISPSEAGAAPSPKPEARVPPPLSVRWSDGAAEITVGDRGGETRLRHLFQSDPCRILFPRVPRGSPMEAVIVTTSGGIVGGDRLRFALRAEKSAVAAITTQAAEKVYRSAGGTSEISIAVEVADGAFLEWMPQETILFDGARLRRTNLANIAGSGRLLSGEIVVFGRRARGETFSHGFLHDGWTIRRDGKTVWRDALRLDGDARKLIVNPHAFDGAAACATMIYTGPDAEARLEFARACLDPPSTGVRAAATRLGDVLVVRFLGRDAALLRARFADLWKNMRHAVAGHPARLPRVWEV